jgi:hypothetical protein
LRRALWDPDAAAAQKKEPTALLQTKVLMVAAFAFGVMVFALLKSGYAVSRKPPLAFYLPCIVVFSVGAVTVYGDAVWREIRRTWEGVVSSEEPDGDDPVPRGPSSAQDGVESKGLWLRNRPNVQPLLVYSLTAIIVVGFAELVWDTGLAIESPYVAFVTAPAVFGPFVARRGGTVAALVLVAVALLVTMTWLFPTVPCHGCANLTDDLHSMTGNALKARVLSWERHRPSPEVYLVSGLAVLALAGTISAQRMRREGKLVRENRDLKRQLRDLGHPAPPSDVIDEPESGDERTRATT